MGGQDRIAVLGGGSHAKVIVSVLTASGHGAIELYDDDEAKWGSRVLDAPVVGAIVEAAGRCDRAVIAVGDNAARKGLAERLEFEWLRVVHPRAYVHESVSLGAGAVIMAGAVLQPGCVVGRHAIINTGALIDHDCVIEDFVHVAPGAALAGDVRLGEGAFLGVRCAVIPGIRIGAWATVGAGAVVVRQVENGVVAFGVPARARPAPGRKM